MSQYPQQPPFPSYPPTPGVYGYPPPSAQPPAPPRQFGIFRAMVMSLSPAVWRDVGRSWSGIGAFYMLLLLALTWLPAFIRAQTGFNTFVQKEAPKLVNQVPKIQITNGVVSCDKPQPYVIKNPDTGVPLIIIDTTGRTTQPPPNAPAMLLTNNKLITREQYQTKTYDLSKVQSFYMDNTTVMGWLEWIGKLIFPVGYPAIVLLDKGWRLLCMIVLAAIGSAFNSNARLPFSALMRLAAIAMTPMILLDTALSFVPMPNVGCIWFFIEAGVAVGILALAVRANGPESSTPGGFAVGPAGYPAYPPPPPQQQQWPQ
jgi:hypothetical protein